MKADLQGKARPADQVLCDLVCFFLRVLKCYHPAIAANLVPPALQPAPGSVTTQATPFAESLAPSGRYANFSTISTD